MPTSEERIKEVGRRAQENGNLIWNAANSLFGAFKPHEYGLVILPMCVIKRFHDCLLPKHDAILAANEQYKDFGDLKDGFLKEAAGYQFYNTSNYTFQSLLSDPENIEDNFRDYLSGFSQNVQQILSRMNFYQQIDRMVEAKCLYQVIVDFCAENLNMGPERISTVDMGYIFEYLVQRFSESYNEEAGAHFTSRDIIYLMCDLLLTNDGLEEKGEGIHCTVYDMTMGTSQMLTCMEERLRSLDENADVQTFGQEINPFTMGIAVADTMIHGGDPDNMKFGDTLSADQFKGYQFDYVISNPPFGIDWKREAEEVEAEFKKGPEGRFEPGLPPKSDGQMLFLLNGIAKLKAGSGKMAIIQNSSSLYSGDAGNGQSEIRRFIIERDWLDAIIQLPQNSFYNTPIETYIWIIDKSKPLRNPGSVLLIDASLCKETRKKNIGSKHVDITPYCSKLIVQAYGNYCTATYDSTSENGGSITVKAQLVESAEFGYQKITVETPLLDESNKPVLKRGKPVADASKRDTEMVPLVENIDDFYEKEIKPYNPLAWIDESKTKIGYEIPFTRMFYDYHPLESAEEIAAEIRASEKKLMDKLESLFGEDMSK